MSTSTSGSVETQLLDATPAELSAVLAELRPEAHAKLTAALQAGGDLAPAAVQLASISGDNKDQTAESFRSRKLSRDNLIGDDAAAADLAARLASNNGNNKDSSQSFRSRKLSKDILIGDSAVAGLVASRSGQTLTALTTPRKEPESHGLSAAPVASRLQVTATAETAAEAARAAAMAGSILFVATEFEGAGDSFASNSPRQSGELKGESIMNSSSSTLAALGDHGKIVGQFSCHGAEPGDEGATAKINQDCVR